MCIWIWQHGNIVLFIIWKRQVNILASRNHDSGHENHLLLANRVNIKSRAALRGVNLLYIVEISCILYTCQSVS